MRRSVGVVLIGEVFGFGDDHRIEEGRAQYGNVYTCAVACGHTNLFIVWQNVLFPARIKHNPFQIGQKKVIMTSIVGLCDAHRLDTLSD